MPTGGATIALGASNAPTGAAAVAAPQSSTAAPIMLPESFVSNPVASNLPTVQPAAIFGAPSSQLVSTAPNAIGADGGGASGVDASDIVVPTAGVAVADGAAEAKHGPSTWAAERKREPLQ